MEANNIDKFTSKVLMSILIFSYLLMEASMQDDTQLRTKHENYLRQFGYLKSKVWSMGDWTHPWSTPDFLASDMPSDEDEFREAVKNFQQMALLPRTGVVDERTSELMNRPRCGLPDITTNANTGKTGRQKRYLFSGSRWGGSNVSYKILSSALNQLNVSSEDVKSDIRKALQLWSNASPLTFRELSSDGKADIELNFLPRDHGDGFPFDGRGGVLAHTFYPGTGTGGDVHFDNEENWSSNSYSGTNILYVATHELGHAIGLAHSNNYSAIMSPFYRPYLPELQLAQDDIDGIQKIYGPPLKGDSGAKALTTADYDITTEAITSTTLSQTITDTSANTITTTTTTTTSTTTTATTSSSSSGTDSSSTTISPTDATTGAITITSAPTSTPFVFTTAPATLNTLDRASASTGIITTGIATSLTTNFAHGNDYSTNGGLTNFVAFSTGFASIFTKGMSTPDIITSSASPSSSTGINISSAHSETAGVSTTVSTAKTLSASIGYSTSSVAGRAGVSNKDDWCSDASVDGVVNIGGLVYFFKGEKYAAVNEMGKIAGYPRLIKDSWPEVPSNLNAVLYWEDLDQLYFFKDSTVWRYNDRTKLDPWYPKPLKEKFGGLRGDIDAAFVLNGNNCNNTYFIEGGQYYLYNRQSETVEPGYPKNISSWEGLPSHIDATFQWNNHQIYFFSGSVFYRSNAETFKVDAGFPRPTAVLWFHCDDRYSI